MCPEYCCIRPSNQKEQEVCTLQMFLNSSALGISMVRPRARLVSFLLENLPIKSKTPCQFTVYKSAKETILWEDIGLQG